MSILSDEERNDLLEDNVYAEDVSETLWLDRQLQIKPGNNVIWRSIMRCRVELLTYWLNRESPLPPASYFSSEGREAPPRSPLFVAINAPCNSDADKRELIQVLMKHGAAETSLPPEQIAELRRLGM